MHGFARPRSVIGAFAALVSLVFLAFAVPTARAQYIYDIRSDGTLEWRKHLGSIGGTFN